MEILNKDGKWSLPELKVSKSRADVPLDRLLKALNEGRAEKKLDLIDYPRLNKMLMKFGKSKKNWSRDVFIGSVLDRKSPAKYFWWFINK